MNIVLVHGILGFSHLDVPLSPIDYFSGVAKFLRERFQDAAVIAPAVDPTAGIETRSTMLRASIEAALAGDGLKPNEPIHIIAHSMGGLDSRRLISKGNFIETNGRRTPIQTLATIGTPHGGSPVADLVALKFLDRIPFLYLSYKLSSRDLVDMMGERGIELAHTTILRWVQRYVPEFEKRWSRYARLVGGSWRCDETYINVKGRWTYLYRAVDKQGRTVDFLRLMATHVQPR